LLAGARSSGGRPESEPGEVLESKFIDPCNPPNEGEAGKGVSGDREKVEEESGSKLGELMDGPNG
jgi:hypothetical protein